MDNMKLLPITATNKEILYWRDKGRAIRLILDGVVIKTFRKSGNLLDKTAVGRYIKRSVEGLES
jgi:hypothetical protein